MCCLLQPGIDKLHHNTREKLVLDKQGQAVGGAWNIPLGGVMCAFKREIGMYQGFEMWSRLLCWDRKWIYVVSHFVKKGTVRPTSYVLSDGSWFDGGRKGYRVFKGAAAEGGVGDGDGDVDEKAIYASAISKYVVKLGRLTIHPEVLLQASNLLPERPGGWHTMSRASGESTPETLVETEGASNIDVKEGETTDEWDWKRIVAENERGLKYVEHFAALDGLHSEFSGSRTAALGKYRDFLW